MSKENSCLFIHGKENSFVCIVFLNVTFANAKSGSILISNYHMYWNECLERQLPVLKGYLKVLKYSSDKRSAKHFQSPTRSSNYTLGIEDLGTVNRMRILVS